MSAINQHIIDALQKAKSAMLLVVRGLEDKTLRKTKGAGELLKKAETITAKIEYLQHNF